MSQSNNQITFDFINSQVLDLEQKLKSATEDIQKRKILTTFLTKLYAKLKHDSKTATISHLGLLGDPLEFELEITAQGFNYFCGADNYFYEWDEVLTEQQELICDLFLYDVLLKTFSNIEDEQNATMVDYEARL